MNWHFHPYDNFVILNLADLVDKKWRKEEKASKEIFESDENQVKCIK